MLVTSFQESDMNLQKDPTQAREPSNSTAVDLRDFARAFSVSTTARYAGAAAPRRLGTNVISNQVAVNEMPFFRCRRPAAAVHIARRVPNPIGSSESRAAGRHPNARSLQTTALRKLGVLDD